MVNVDQDVRVDFALKVGNTSETVMVTTEAPLVTTENGELGTTLTSKQVADLPSYRRDILSSLPLLSPGVTQGREGYDGDTPLYFSVNGGRALTQDLVVDGAESISVNISAWGSNGAMFVPNQDAVQRN